MAPLPQNNTGRLFLDYTSAGIPHTLMFRYAGTENTVDLLAAADLLADHMAQAMINTDAVTGARYSQEGTNFSLPLNGFDTQVGVRTVAGNLWTEDPDSAFYSVTGRDGSDGREWKLLHFTPYNFGGGWPGDNRFNAGENATADSIREGWQQLMNGDGGMPFAGRSISGGFVVTNGWLNIAKNAYRQRKQRTG